MNINDLDIVLDELFFAELIAVL